MENPLPDSRDASSTDAADAPSASLPPSLGSAHPEAGSSEAETYSSRTTGPTAALEGDVCAPSAPLDPLHPSGPLHPHVPPAAVTAFTETQRLRHDGWTPDKKRLFLERFAECGVLVEACRAVGMSARAAYNLHDRDPLFAAGWEAASAMARPRLADEAFARSINGVVERIYKDGVVVAERHRYDNRLTMSVLARLDARADKARETGAPHLGLVARWEEYLASVGEDRREDGLALLTPPEPPAPSPASAVHAHAHTHARAAAYARAAAQPDQPGDRELRELRLDDEETRASAIAAAKEEDRHSMWEEDDGWWTDYPPPLGFIGEEDGNYGDDGYSRTLSEEEQAVVDRQAALRREEARAKGEALRASRFAALTPEPGGAP